MQALALLTAWFNSNRLFFTHWVIGIVACAIWGWGDKLGVASTLQTYAAYTLPLLIGHAVGRATRDKPADLPLIPPAAPMPAPAQPVELPDPPIVNPQGQPQ